MKKKVAIVLAVLAAGAVVWVIVGRQGQSSAQNLRNLWTANMAYAADHDGLDIPVYTLTASKEDFARWKQGLIRYGAKESDFQAPGDLTFDILSDGMMGTNYPGSSYGHSIFLMPYRMPGMPPLSLTNPPAALANTAFLQERAIIDERTGLPTTWRNGDYLYITIEGKAGSSRVPYDGVAKR